MTFTWGVKYNLTFQTEKNAIDWRFEFTFGQWSPHKCQKMSKNQFVWLENKHFMNEAIVFFYFLSLTASRQIEFSKCWRNNYKFLLGWIKIVLYQPLLKSIVIFSFRYGDSNDRQSTVEESLSKFGIRLSCFQPARKNGDKYLWTEIKGFR